MLTIIFTIAALWFLASAAICSARMDTVDDHWSISIYKKNSVDLWFDSNVSWVLKNPDKKQTWLVLSDQFLPWWIKWLRKVKPQWAPISDFWHWEKSKMIIYLINCAVCMLAAGYFFHDSWKDIFLVIFLSIYAIKGGLWNLIFNLYYDRKLVVKGYRKKWLWLKPDK